MKSSQVNSIPPWLGSVTPVHLETVYEILEQRESKRDCARLASRLPSQVSDEQATYTHSLLRLFKFTESLSLQSHYSVAVAALPENLHSNRYMDVAPYDRTRVVVDYQKGESKQGGSDYLNASWVLEQFGQKWWIATQAPLTTTAHTFLSLFLQPIPCPPKALSPSPAAVRKSRLRTIVQLTMYYEHGRKKADPYFPKDVGKSLIIPSNASGATSPLKVTLVRQRSIPEAHCIHSTITISTVSHPGPQTEPDGQNPPNALDDKDDYGEEEDREITTVQHMLYTAWPDHGVPEPEDEASLLAFIRLVDSTNRDISLVTEQDPDPDPPIVVGCSAGIGRTGSFIALSSLLRSHGFLPPPVSPTPSSVLPRCPLGRLPRVLKDDLVAEEIDSLREQRPGMVQRNEQISLIYDILGAAFGMH